MVAEAIIDALQNDRADVIVGGTGHVLVLLSRLIPGLHRWMAPSVWRDLEDRSKQPHRENSLYRPIGGARERTAEPPTFWSSVATAAGRHAWLTAAVVVAAATVAFGSQKRV